MCFSGSVSQSRAQRLIGLVDNINLLINLYFDEPKSSLNIICRAPANKLCQGSRLTFCIGCTGAPNFFS